jgi:hypothetical protein
VIEPRRDDELPVWADALCDRGDPRGDFVNCQLAADRLPASDPRRLELLKRAELLLEQHERSWVGPLPLAVENWRFRHGRLAAVSVDAELFLDTRRMRALLEARGVRCVAILYGSLGAARLDAVIESPLRDTLVYIEIPRDLRGDGLRHPSSQTQYFAWTWNAGRGK